MLPERHRLTTDYDFRKVRRRGRNLKTPLFNLGCLVKRSDSPARFGFVASTKLDKRAVKRNKVKRVFRESVRAVLPRVKNGFDFVFWIKRKALEADSKEVQKTVEEALRKVEVLESA